jgi:maltoporin
MYVLQTLGGVNKLVAQYGVGPAAADNGVIGPLTNDSDRTMLRFLDHLDMQPTPEFGGQLLAVYERDDFADDTHSEWISAGGRVSYALHENAQLLFELGYDTFKPADGGDRRNLTKITFAPAITGGKGFWARPHLRVFGTYALWNDAAQAGVDSGGVYADKSSGATFGMQGEGWW